MFTTSALFAVKEVHHKFIKLLSISQMNIMFAVFKFMIAISKKEKTTQMKCLFLVEMQIQKKMNSLGVFDGFS